VLVPEFLQPTNGLRRRADDPDMLELSTALLERNKTMFRAIFRNNFSKRIVRLSRNHLESFQTSPVLPSNFPSPRTHTDCLGHSDSEGLLDLRADPLPLEKASVGTRHRRSLIALERMRWWQCSLREH